MKIIDTHAHMCDSLFDRDLPEVLSRAANSGITGIVTVSEDLKDARKNLELAATHSLLLPAAGLFPTNLDLGQAEDMFTFIRQQQNQIFSIGEVGLDYWKIKEDEERRVQKEIFKGFIRLSRELGLPLNVHSRSAGRHVVALLLEEGASKVQLHAFDGKASTALPAVEAGFFFSIPPSIVRSRQKQKLVRQLPLTSILIETDSPVLGPDPRTRNEPANARIAIDAIAEIKGIRPEEVAEVAYRNTLRLYNLQ